MGLFRYGFVVTGVFFILLGLDGSGDFCLISYMIVLGVIVCPGCFFNMAPHTVQSNTCSGAFTTLVGHDLFRVFGYHVAF